MLVVTPNFGELLVVPFQPEAPMTERLKWNTDVGTSFNGSEDRVELLTPPRQRFIMAFSATDVDRNRDAFAMAFGGLKRRAAMGIWGEASYVGTLTSGATSAAVNTDHADWREPGLALIWGSPTKWELREIDAISAGQVDFTVALDNDYQRAFVMPARIGYFDGDITAQLRGFSQQLKATFDVEDGIDLDPAAPTQYLGSDVNLSPSLFNESDEIDETYTGRTDKFDGETGPVSRINPWLHNRRRRQYRLVAEGQAEVWELREFLHRRKGRYREFWEPTHVADFKVVSTGALTTVVRVSGIYQLDLLASRVHVAIQKTDESWLLRAITDASLAVGNTTDLTLDTSIAINASQIKMISYLGLQRLDDDDVGLDWIGNNVVELVSSVQELEP